MLSLCRYAELLKEIRLGHVKKVMYFDNDEIAVNIEDYQEIEGPCLVVFKDDRVAQSYIPRFDYRIPYAPSLPPEKNPAMCHFSCLAAKGLQSNGIQRVACHTMTLCPVSSR